MSLHRVVFLAPFVALSAFFALRILTTPDPRGYGTHEQLGFAPCGLREVFNGPCPTCGVTTSASLAVRGEFASAWQAQPLGLLLLMVAALGSVFVIRAERRGVDLGAVAMRHGRAFWIAMFVATLASWLAARS